MSEANRYTSVQKEYLKAARELANHIVDRMREKESQLKAEEASSDAEKKARQNFENAKSAFGKARLKAKEGLLQTQDDGVMEQVNRSRTPVERNRLEAQKQDPDLYYEFIGESYIHGMMDGEALRKKFYSDLVDRTFELR